MKRFTTPLRPDKGSRIALSPWSRDAMDLVAMAILEARCAELGVYVSTVKRTRRPGDWMVRVNGGGDRRVSLVGSGSLEVVLAGALDDFESMPDEEEQSPDMNREGDPAFNGAFNRW